MNEPPAFGTFVIIALTAWGSFQGFRNPAFRDRFIFTLPSFGKARSSMSRS